MSPVKVLNTAMGSLVGNNGCTVMNGSPQKISFSCVEMETAMIKDIHLKRAAEQAEREGSERPLVMQQLRTKIQLERLRHGKNELTVTFDQPQKYELTEEEKGKLEKRKVRNREAAKKSRIKKKCQHSHLEKQHKKLKVKNSGLRAQINKLYDVITSMQESAHQARVCPGNSPQAFQLHVIPDHSQPGQSLSAVQQWGGSAARALSRSHAPPRSVPVVISGGSRSSAVPMAPHLSRGQYVFFDKGNHRLIAADHHGLTKARHVISTPRLLIPGPTSGTVVPRRDPPHTVTSGSAEGEAMNIETTGAESSSPPLRVIPKVKVSPSPAEVGSEFGGPFSRQPVMQTIATDDLGDLVSMEAAAPAAPPVQCALPCVADDMPQNWSFLQLLQEDCGHGKEEDEEMPVTAGYKPDTPLVAMSSANHFLLSFSSAASLPFSSSPSSSSSPTLSTTVKHLTRGL